MKLGASPEATRDTDVSGFRLRQERETGAGAVSGGAVFAQPASAVVAAAAPSVLRKSLRSVVMAYSLQHTAAPM